MADLSKELERLERDLEAVQRALRSKSLRGNERQHMLATEQEIQSRIQLLNPVVEATPTEMEMEEPVRQTAPAQPVPMIDELSSDSELDVRRWVFDFVYAAESLPIDYRPGMTDTVKTAGPMYLTDMQKKLVALIVQRALIEKQPLRLQILKSRQLGCTTLLLALALWLMETIPGFRVLFIIDKDHHLYTKRRNIINWVTALSKKSGMFHRLKRGGQGQKILELTNGSIMFLESAQAPNPGTSDMYHMVITSEEPKWVTGRPEQVKASIYPGVPYQPGTFIIRESTAEGLGLFYRDWIKSIRGQSGFIAFFAAWYLSQEYQSEADPNRAHSKLDPHDYTSEYGDINFEDDTRELTELEYQNRYKLSINQLRWRRLKIDELGSRALFDQEFPTTWRHAFRSTSLGFYSPSSLDAVEREIRPPIFVGSIKHGGGEAVDRTVHYSLLRPMLVKDPAGELQIIEMPVQGRKYFGGVDCSEGLTAITDEGEDPDFTVMSIKDESGRTVAIWRGHIKPEEAWYPYCLLGAMYNMATLNGELQNAGALLLQMRTAAYPHLMVEPEPKARPAIERTWTRTTKGNRDLLLAAHRKAVREDPRRVGFSCLFDEMSVFVRNKTGKFGAASGFHDDVVMADVMAEYCRLIYLGLWKVVLDQPEPKEIPLFVEPPSGEVALWQTDVMDQVSFDDMFLENSSDSGMIF